MSRAHRTATIHRKTGETDVRVEINLDGAGDSTIATGIGFFDHMLTLLARHSAIDIDVMAEGDLQVDFHHTVEDVGLSLGKAVLQALGDKAGIRRYGHTRLPMDEALVEVAIDLSGRPFFRGSMPFPCDRVGDFPVELVEEFLKSLVTEGRMALHVDVLAGTNGHHISEAVFKGVARALRMAIEPDGRMTGVPSTKGSLSS